MVTPYVYTTNCQAWCADQFYHASTQHVFLIFLAALSLVCFFVFRVIWSRLDDKPFSEDIAERIVNGLLTLTLVFLLLFLVYHYFVNEPANTTEMLKNFSKLIPDNPLNEVNFLFNNTGG